ncbi:hypothetical protein AQUSIP_24380 [Aquicella siphonis]|uniref:Flagellar FliJ protein n=1 Tax=Aquicella siphonis TaxID=254247 RepID=A0A5E4PL28_9COXI|nr:hypothetical protein [Aquicella siphonis]VVC77111.1 hypothetical protein AQUSIP_24380 [Aquicella siphonis]
MKNLSQISVVNDALHRQREALMTDLRRINVHIRKKEDSLQKIIAYQNEYTNGTHLSISRSVPVLSKNLDSFTKKMNDIIHAEEMEIGKLMKARGEKLKQIEALDNKLKIMTHFSENIRLEQAIKTENIEQMIMDEMSVNKRSRGDNE